MQTDQKTDLDNTNIVYFICREIERVATTPPDSSLGSDTDMTVDVSIDSVAIMDVVFALEEEYDVSVPLGALGEIRKVGELADLVLKLKG